MLYSVVALSVVAFTSIIHGANLIDVLNASGATQFATFIQSDPSVLSVYQSGSVQTVFAPLDSSVVSINTTNAKGKRALSPQDKQKALIHSSQSINSIGDMSSGSGTPITTNDNTGNIGGQSQKVVSNPLNQTGGGVARRQTSSTELPSLLKIFSGLGNNVSIVKADIPYDGGLIQIVDNYFTLPTGLSNTAAANGQTAFNQLSAASNLTAVLDNTPSITCFIPSNAAFAAPNSTSKYNSSASLLSGHIIPNFIGYLPTLKNGATYTTQAGTILTITVRGSDYYINNAKIIASNQILENGVAHVIDSIITPSSGLGIVNTSSGSLTRSGSGLGVWAFVIGVGSLVFCWFM